MNARIEKKDEIKRTITIGGTEYAMPKVAPDVYMDYLEARESIFTSEEKHMTNLTKLKWRCAKSKPKERRKFT